MPRPHVSIKPDFWQFAIVPKHNAVVIYFHLCMYSHIVTVYDGIANSLTQHILGYFQLLYTCYPFVVNRGQKVLGTQQFNDMVYHLQNISFYNVLCDQVALVIAETTDTEIARHKESLRVLAKEQ